MASNVAAPKVVCDRTPCTRLPSRDVLLSQWRTACWQQKPSTGPAWRKMRKEKGRVYMRQFGIVCRASYTHGKVLIGRTPISGLV